MNLPNKLTMLRVILIPVFVIFMFLTEVNAGFRWVAVLIFIVASLTDMADGKIARSRNLVTDFGKFMDPLADKLLVTTAMICLVQMHPDNKVFTVVVLVIVAREFAISGFRLIAAEKGIVIAANYWGKFKTTFQMIMIILMIVNIPQLAWLTTVVMWVALALTIISFCTYIAQNKSVISGPM